MHIPWSRTGAILALLGAIVSGLGRRAWWAYRGRGWHGSAPRTTIVARRPTDRYSYVPRVTPAWNVVVAGALPIQAEATVLKGPDEVLPVIWIDVAERPDIADLPRVLAGDQAAGDGPPLLAAQWLADCPGQRIVLVVTVVEPVTCTWAVNFELPHRRLLLERIVDAGELFVGWSDLALVGLEDEPSGLPREGLLLRMDNRAELNAILAMWTGRHDVV